MAQYLLVFLAGLAGSLHRVGMCGGFACVLGADPRGREAPLRRHLIYNAGRVTTYVFLGALAGLLGATLLGGPNGGEPLLLAQRLLAPAPGLLMVFVGLPFLGWHGGWLRGGPGGAPGRDRKSGGEGKR